MAASCRRLLSMSEHVTSMELESSYLAVTLQRACRSSVRFPRRVDARVGGAGDGVLGSNIANVPSRAASIAVLWIGKQTDWI